MASTVARKKSSHLQHPVLWNNTDSPSRLRTFVASSSNHLVVSGYDPSRRPFLRTLPLQLSLHSNPISALIMLSELSCWPCMGNYSVFSDARKVFDEMCERGLVSWSSIVSLKARFLSCG